MSAKAVSSSGEAAVNDWLASKQYPTHRIGLSPHASMASCMVAAAQPCSSSNAWVISYKCSQSCLE
eukprot:10928479-Karenia_brevis.AAC.1